MHVIIFSIFGSVNQAVIWFSWLLSLMPGCVFLFFFFRKAVGLHLGNAAISYLYLYIMSSMICLLFSYPSLKS